MSKVVFFYDVVCPYAYLGSTQIAAACARHGAELEWKPMLLGGVFRDTQRPEPSTSPAKLSASAEDQLRWARAWGVPLTFPAGHPRRSVEAMRLCVAAGVVADGGKQWRSTEKVSALSQDLFRSYWVEGKDIADRATLAEAATRHGLDPAAIDRDDVKLALRTNTDEAVAAGVFGAPSFLVTNSHGTFLFWGQDRLHFVEKALDGWAVPA